VWFFIEVIMKFIDSKTLEKTCEGPFNGETVLDFIVNEMGVGARLVRKIKRKKGITVNGHKISVNAKLRRGDDVRLVMELEPNIFNPEDLPLDVIFENEDLLVVNKAPFMVVHPTKGHPYGTLGNAIANYFEKKNWPFKIRFINRLDRDTSGIVLVAKNGYAQSYIAKMMSEDLVDKRYKAIVTGPENMGSGTIDEPIGLEHEDDIARKVFPGGQDSVTHYSCLCEKDNIHLVDVKLETGRTHQIRVHLQHIGYPIIADHLYGSETPLINRQALHCYSMSMPIPRSGERMTFMAPVPEDMQRIIDTLNGENCD